ncbi:MAG: trypsin-like peptidase domain-containing protein [Coleofasciculus sp. S288]|nr:trypsin-like peptidase domain-containing protein [Coleofasciculus sp. S288]
MSQLENLLQQCTVKLTIPGGWGTGFFVAPGLILTCAHVVQGAKDEPIQVRWQTQENWAEAVVERSLPEPYDLALLRVMLPADANPPCVYLDVATQSRDSLYLFGYPDQDFPNGCPVTFNCEGLTGDEPALIKFALGQVRPGMSGAPLLNQRTGKVCGIVKFTRDRSFDLGGGAIPTAVILAQFPELVEQQRAFHQCNQRWNDLVAELLSSDEAISQTNLGGTNYQTQIGVANTNVIGGVHYHQGDASQGKQTVKKILLLSANPENPETVRRRKETKEIRDVLKRAKHGDLCELHDRPDINAAELSQELTTIEPDIIDISGCENGIECLTLDENIEKNARTEAEKLKLIAELFQLHYQSIKCIILNGCYSEEQAREIVQHIDFVIGISRDLEDDRVIKFLSEFYYYIGSERTIRDSYNLSCNYLQRRGLEDINILPTLLDKYNERKRRELEEELSVCDKEIEKNPNNVELWKKRGSLLKELGRAEEANEAYEKASSLAPNDYKIRTEQGDALEQLEKYEEAVNAYDKALELETEDYKVWWKKGQALVEVKKYGEAVESYDKAVALAIKLEQPSPERYIICREYASLLNKLEEYQKSIFMYKKSLGFEPRYRASSYLKRQVYKKMFSGRG